MPYIRLKMQHQIYNSSMIRNHAQGVSNNNEDSGTNLFLLKISYRWESPGFGAMQRNMPDSTANVVILTCKAAPRINGWTNIPAATNFHFQKKSSFVRHWMFTVNAFSTRHQFVSSSFTNPSCGSW